MFFVVAEKMYAKNRAHSNVKCSGSVLAAWPCVGLDDVWAAVYSMKVEGEDIVCASGEVDIVPREHGVGLLYLALALRTEQLLV